MQLQNAERKRAKIKMSLQGPSGSGKTYGSLLLGFGLSNDWTKIAVIDSENNSAHLYAHLGKYKVISIQPPFAPEKFIEAINICENAGIQVIIIDGISAEWEGNGGILEIHGNMTGNSFTAWSKVTPRHNAFIQSILQSPLHVISTVRSKMDYILVDKNGKQVPEKVGLKGITKEGFDFEMTLVFELDIRGNVTVTKDRTSLFTSKPEFKISPEIGRRILSWCNLPPEVEAIDIDNKILIRINACKTIDELLCLYRDSPQVQKSLLPQFTKKRQLLTVSNDFKNIINQQNLPTNGNSTFK